MEKTLKVLFMFITLLLIGSCVSNFHNMEKYNYPNNFKIAVEMNDKKYRFENESIIDGNCISGLSKNISYDTLIKERTICGEFTQNKI